MKNSNMYEEYTRRLEKHESMQNSISDAMSAAHDRLNVSYLAGQYLKGEHAGMTKTYEAYLASACGEYGESFVKKFSATTATMTPQELEGVSQNLDNMHKSARRTEVIMSAALPVSKIGANAAREGLDVEFDKMKGVSPDTDSLAAVDSYYGTVCERLAVIVKESYATNGKEPDASKSYRDELYKDLRSVGVEANEADHIAEYVDDVTKSDDIDITK